jgi:hypothetical protein
MAWAPAIRIQPSWWKADGLGIIPAVGSGHVRSFAQRLLNDPNCELRFECVQSDRKP